MRDAGQQDRAARSENETRPTGGRAGPAGEKARPAAGRTGKPEKGSVIPKEAGPAKPMKSAARRKLADLPRRRPRPVWVVTLFAFILPGSGQMLNGDPVRGVIMQFFMLLFSYITYQLSSPDTSIVGKLAGGIAIYVISVLDANGIAKRRVAAWERLKTSGEVTEERVPPKDWAGSAKRPSTSRGRHDS